MDFYIMKSNGLVHAPGMVPYFISMYKTGKDSEKLLAIEGMSAWESLPASVILDILREKKEFIVQDGDVLIEKAA